jgi:signal transduction histidine kinase
MSEETKNRVFEPFFTTREVGRGTGLGMATAIGVVTKHGGSITIDSKEGVGTTVSVELPDRTK